MPPRCRSISTLPSEFPLPAPRSCHLRLEQYSEAIRAASSALEIRPEDAKGLYRRCSAYIATGELELARADLAQVSLPLNHHAA